MSGMKNLVEVQAAVEFRANVPSVLKRFRAEHAAAEPVVFGSNRRPEGVAIPYELYLEIEPILEDLEIARLVRARQAAGPAVPLEDVAAEFGIELNDLGA